MNIYDYFEGRQAAHVLSDMQVREIRRDYEPPVRQPNGTWKGNGKQLARKYGVCKKTIYNIVNGYTYTWVSEHDTGPMHLRKRTEYITKQQVRNIRTGYKGKGHIGYVKNVCDRYNIHRNTVYRILRGETHKDEPAS